MPPSHMLKVRHQLTTNYFAQRLRAPHGRCHDCARARAEGSTAALSARHAFGADNRVADVAGSDRSVVFNWSAVEDSRSRGCPDCGGHAGSDRLWEMGRSQHRRCRYRAKYTTCQPSKHAVAQAVRWRVVCRGLGATGHNYAMASCAWRSLL